MSRKIGKPQPTRKKKEDYSKKRRGGTSRTDPADCLVEEEIGRGRESFGGEGKKATKKIAERRRRKQSRQAGRDPLSSAGASGQETKSEKNTREPPRR